MEAGSRVRLIAGETTAPRHDFWTSPASFLEKMRPPAGIQYKRVTSRFFAVSSIKDGRTWYNRGNRAVGFMNCILLNYPAAEDRQWDVIVTRISLSLAP
jgi:hypothetical protein